MVAPEVRTLEVFAGVVKVVLMDGQLTQEEKRLLISIARSLDLDDGEPKQVYEAVVAGEEVVGGHPLDDRQCSDLYMQALRVAYVNFDMSSDEQMLFAHLEQTFGYGIEKRAQGCKDIREEEEKRLEGEYSGSALRKARKRLREFGSNIISFGQNGGKEESSDAAVAAPQTP